MKIEEIVFVLSCFSLGVSLTTLLFVYFMSRDEFYKIIIRRGSFNKKGLLCVLSDIFKLDVIHHDAIAKTYSVPASEVAKLDKVTLNLLSKLTRHFSHYDILQDEFLIFKYSLL